MGLYIRLATKKMWATSRKCVFYGIFKNTTKHQKIFFEMQPNTWKHFPFRKIAFLENRIFSKNTFTQTKRSLCFKILGPVMDPQQISYSWLYVLFFFILFYLKLYYGKMKDFTPKKKRLLWVNHSWFMMPKSYFRHGYASVIKWNVVVTPWHFITSHPKMNT